MSAQSALSLVILAAGKGTRMKSKKAKVLHQVFYAPMLHHVLNAVKPLNAVQTVVIVGHQREEVESSIAGFAVTPCVQKEQLGTGHAVLCAESMLAGIRGTVMILCGDTPLILTETLEQMFAHHITHGGPLTVMTTILDNPTHYGRILADEVGHVRAIVEEKDATPEQKKIKEINAGIYCVDADFLFTTLKKIGINNSQGEVYLTDIVEIATAQNVPVAKYVTSLSQNVLGVNSRIELAEAHNELQMRRNRVLMLKGVSMINSSSISIAPDVKIGQDTVLYPNVHITGNSFIGKNCILENGAILKDCAIGDNVYVGAYSYLERCNVEAGKTIAPQTLLREKQ